MSDHTPPPPPCSSPCSRPAIPLGRQQLPGYPETARIRKTTVSELCLDLNLISQETSDKKKSPLLLKVFIESKTERALGSIRSNLPISVQKQRRDTCRSRQRARHGTRPAETTGVNRAQNHLAGAATVPRERPDVTQNDTNEDGDVTVMGTARRVMGARWESLESKRSRGPPGKPT